ncbi:hypothetical protein PISMIDRAFT_14189 [Pisolithus microcarpus 441]|uniref:Unplaced genomic scaffold scaffold_115, whole genome shotgun sequence n=1 Tax=Pisolithus microcarpus 441 TaxID=765257 RepID=A0A0C9ZFD6_9AGAM|nr:hypothetical protein PISMIDRAFT_14189 [Pisolithus microcarpus 441]
MVVSSDEDDGSWQVTSTTEDNTEETVTHIKMIKTTRKGTTEMVKTMVKHRTHSTKTTLRSPQRCSPSVSQSPVAITTSASTLPSSPGTPRPTRKPQSDSGLITSLPSVCRSSTSQTAVIPHPSDVPHPTSMPEGFYLIIVGQEVGIFYTW